MVGEVGSRRIAKGWQRDTDVRNVADDVTPAGCLGCTGRDGESRR